MKLAADFKPKLLVFVYQIRNEFSTQSLKNIQYRISLRYFPCIYKFICILCVILLVTNSCYICCRLMLHSLLIQKMKNSLS